MARCPGHSSWPQRVWAAESAHVFALCVAPGETGPRAGHLLDHRVALAERVGARVAGLGFAATDVPAMSARAKIEPTAALLASIAAG